MAEPNAYLKPEILAQITRLGLRAHRVVEGTISGLHRSPLHGVSVEFAEYREYSPGDDLKRLDWRAYARSNRYFIKRYEEESNLRCTILLDASASMRYQSGQGAKGKEPARRGQAGGAGGAGGAEAPAAGERAPGKPGMSKFDYAATLAASLATLLIRQRDAVGLALFDEAQRAFLRPAATQSQLAKVIDVLEKAKPDRHTDLAGAMSQVADQIRGRGLVVLISDLLVDLDRFYESLGRLQYQGHEVIVFQVLDRDEIELPFNDSVLFRDIEGAEELQAEPWAFRKAYKAAMEEFVAEVTRRCRFGGIDHLLLRTDDDLGLGLSHYLHQRLRFAGAKRSGKVAKG